MSDSRPLAAVATIIMGNSPTGDTCNRLGLGTPLLNGPTEFGAEHPVPVQWTNDGRRICQQGDLLFCVRGSTTGRMNFADQPYAVGRGLAAIRGATPLDTRYIYYCLRGFMPRLLSLTAGSVFPSLSTKDLQGFQIPWSADRHGIVNLLGAIDDRIAVARRIQRDAESIALAVFDGRTSDANEPDVILTEVAEVTKGVSYRSDDLVAAAQDALVTLKSVGRRGTYEQRGLKPYAGVFKPSQRVLPGEIAVAQTDLTQAGNVIGQAVRVRPSARHERLVASLDLAIIRPQEGRLTNEFLYGVLRQRDFREHALGYSNGTTVLHLSSRAFVNYVFKLPSPEKVEATTRLMRPLLDRVDAAETEVEALAAMRDGVAAALLTGALRRAAHRVELTNT